MVAVQRRRFTADEYQCMARAGILDPDERVELLDGEIVQMAAMGSKHNACVDKVNVWPVANLALTGRAQVRVQGSFRLSMFSEPEPDLVLLRPRADFYAEANPGPGDVLLVVEVSDTTLRKDRTVKLPLYAREGIPEVWIVDLNGERVLVYRGPEGGVSRRRSTVRRGGMLRLLAFPDLALPVADLLP